MDRGALHPGEGGCDAFTRRCVLNKLGLSLQLQRRTPHFHMYKARGSPHFKGWGQNNSQLMAFWKLKGILEEKRGWGWGFHQKPGQNHLKKLGLVSKMWVVDKPRPCK